MWDGRRGLALSEDRRAVGEPLLSGGGSLLHRWHPFPMGVRGQGRRHQLLFSGHQSHSWRYSPGDFNICPWPHLSRLLQWILNSNTWIWGYAYTKNTATSLPKKMKCLTDFRKGKFYLFPTPMSFMLWNHGILDQIGGNVEMPYGHMSLGRDSLFSFCLWSLHLCFTVIFTKGKVYSTG